MDKTDVALRQREIYKVTLAGSVVNIVLTLCKFAAGILGRSAAMVADHRCDSAGVRAYFRQAGRQGARLRAREV